jgi:GntP family gluconate:H+ symporter
MFVGLICFLLLGYPVAFSLGACGLFFGFIGIETGHCCRPPLLQACRCALIGIMQNDTLLAIPFFTFMGLILERSRHGRGPARHHRPAVRPDARRPGHAVIFVGALLAATTGVVAASVISMGLISLPIMLRYGYDRRIASRRDRRLGHAGADHSALAGADHHGRPAGPQRGRHVQGRLPVPAFMLVGCTCSTWSAGHLQAPVGAALPPEARTTASPTAAAAYPRCWC